MLLSILAALALGASPEAPTAPPADAAARPKTVSGTLSEVVPAQHRVTMAAADGPVTLSLDRNTLVFLETRQGTVQDLAAGLPARASVGPKGEAYWIELLPPGAASPTPPPSPASTTSQSPGPTQTPSGPTEPAKPGS